MSNQNELKIKILRVSLDTGNKHKGFIQHLKTPFK